MVQGIAYHLKKYIRCYFSASCEGSMIQDIKIPLGITEVPPIELLQGIIPWGITQICHKTEQFTLFSRQLSYFLFLVH